MKITHRIMPFVFLITFFSLALLPTKAAFAASQPDPKKNPVLATVIASGARLFYLGKSNGLDGWFVIKDGQAQIAYAIPDSNAAVVGLLFENKGDNVTNEQIKKLAETNTEVNALFTGQGGQISAPPTSNPAVVSSPAPAPAAATEQQAAGSLGDQLIQDLQAISGVTVGNAGPQILMVMDPDCPHCQKVWKDLRDQVMKGRLQIRLIPIGLDAGGERTAAQLLSVPSPLQAWDKYAAGDKSQLAGTPDSMQLAAVRTNRTVTQKWKIGMTPYLVYRNKEGKVKIVQGELDKPSVLLGDLGL